MKLLGPVAPEFFNIFPISKLREGVGMGGKRSGARSYSVLKRPLEDYIASGHAIRQMVLITVLLHIWQSATITALGL